MGVGTYRDDFRQTGGTFIVSGPLTDDEAYEEYRKDVGDEDALPREEWDQEDYNDFNAQLADILRGAASELGLDIEDESRFANQARAGFDRDFCLIASCDQLHLGWRSWEHDFVVGVGASKIDDTLFGTDPGNVREELIKTYRLPAAKVADAYATLQDGVLSYVRLSLMEAGIECRYPTSGYTSSAFVRAENADSEKAGLREQVNEALTILTPRDGNSDRQNLPASDRRALLADIAEAQKSSGYDWDRQDMIAVALLYSADDHYAGEIEHADKGLVIVVNALDNSAEPLRSFELTDPAMKAHLESIAAGDGELVPLRFDDETARPWLEKWLSETPNPYWNPFELLVDTDDVLAATNGAHQIELRFTEIEPLPRP